MLGRGRKRSQWRVNEQSKASCCEAACECRAWGSACFERPAGAARARSWEKRFDWGTATWTPRGEETTSNRSRSSTRPLDATRWPVASPLSSARGCLPARVPPRGTSRSPPFSRAILCWGKCFRERRRASGACGEASGAGKGAWLAKPEAFQRRRRVRARPQRAGGQRARIGAGERVGLRTPRRGNAARSSTAHLRWRRAAVSPSDAAMGSLWRASASSFSLAPSGWRGAERLGCEHANESKPQLEMLCEQSKEPRDPTVFGEIDALGQWRFVDDQRVPWTNDESERPLRSIVVGRKAVGLPRHVREHAGHLRAVDLGAELSPAARQPSEAPRRRDRGDGHRAS